MATTTIATTNEGLIKYQNDMARRRRIQQQALAILKRAKEADIPQEKMRIPEEKFRSLMDTEYFKLKGMKKSDVDELCYDCFNNPQKMMKVKFILIDGGGSELLESRQTAGFALLFRMIAWDKTGCYMPCVKAVNNLKPFNAIGDITRNEFMDTLKEPDALFLGECSRNLFLKGVMDAATLFDELLGEREMSCKPTIITMTNPIPYKHEESANRTNEISTGQFMQVFTDSDTNIYNNILRIRVK